MKTKEVGVFYHQDAEQRSQMCELLSEILTTLYSRADGVKIEVERTTEFPPLSPISKPLICNVKIETWDIAA